MKSYICDSLSHHYDLLLSIHNDGASAGIIIPTFAPGITEIGINLCRYDLVRSYWQRRHEKSGTYYLPLWLIHQSG